MDNWEKNWTKEIALRLIKHSDAARKGSGTLIHEAAQSIYDYIQALLARQKEELVAKRLQIEREILNELSLISGETVSDIVPLPQIISHLAIIKERLARYGLSENVGDDKAMYRVPDDEDLRDAQAMSDAEEMPNLGDGV